MAKATFAAGCFWGVEDAFRQVKGVTSTTVGYSGGTKRNPTYKEVCTGATGHAESVEVEYDPKQVSYRELLAVFFQSHDPTTLNRQGPDVGTQYRSVIFFHDAEQEALAREAKASLEKASVFKRPIVTEIAPAPDFYRAEEYHQQYFEKQGIRSCHV
jgi:peptide-methionine (S)-S-oxide reductase